MAQHKRRIKLIKPMFQIKMVSIFLCLSVACMVVQFTLLNVAMTDMAMSVPQYSLAISTEAFSILWRHLLLTVGLMVPLTLFVGILVTFRVAGPIYRFEKHFREIAEGDNPPDCFIRDGDEFHELCALINQAVDVLKEQNPQHAGIESDSESDSPQAEAESGGESGSSEKESVSTR